MAAPSLVQVGIVNALVTATTGTLTWQANDVVVALLGNEGSSGDTLSFSNTGSGLSFGAALRTQTASGTVCGANLFAAVASSGSSGTFTATCQTTHDCSIGVYIFRSSAGIGVTNLASGALTASITMSGADSAVVWAVYDFGAAAVQTASPVASSHNSSTPGPTASPTAAVDGTRYTYYYEEFDDQVATGAHSFGVAAGTAANYTVIVCEVKAGAATGLPFVSPQPNQSIKRAAFY